MLDAHLTLAALQISSLRDKPQWRPAVQSFFDEATNTASYVVHDPATRRAAIIDSVLDYDSAAGRTSTASADRIIEFITRHRLVVDWLLETHAHADHLSAAPYLQQRLGGKLAIGREIIRVQRVFEKRFNAGTDFQAPAPPAIDDAGKR
jgi:glyoxylase-like metal-dependent hydrolase (beta-lactamase superfamily II)